MNDITLRCNIYECHRHLPSQAVVTTCSHIFCSDCANNLFTAERKCPSCQEPLLRPDDVVLANLDPTEDYKSSVLSGLAPDIIMDISRRAMDFWTYQASQELQLKSYELDKLRKNTSLVDQTLKVQIKDAKREIEQLKAQLNELVQERQMFKSKSAELGMQLQEKRQQHDKLQMAYDKIKRKGQPIMQQAVKDPSLSLGTDRRHSWHERSDVPYNGLGPPLATTASASLNARSATHYQNSHSQAFVQPSPRGRPPSKTRSYMPPDTPVSVIRARLQPGRSSGMRPF